MRALVLLLVCVSFGASAQVDEKTKCEDNYADCHDSCSLRYGMVTRDTERVKLAKCIDRCKRTASECKERYFETKNNALDDSALKKVERDDDLREDNKKTAIVPDEKPRSKPREEEQPKRTSTRADELGKDKEKKSEKTASEDPRYDMKFEEEKKPEPKKEEPAPKKQASLDSDVRKEDSEAAPPPKSEKKKSADDEPKKSKKKDRALDEWDPEAL